MIHTQNGGPVADVGGHEDGAGTGSLCEEEPCGPLPPHWIADECLSQNDELDATHTEDKFSFDDVHASAHARVVAGVPVQSHELS